MYDDANFAAMEGRGSRPDKCIVRFHVRPVEIPYRSAQEGRPIFEDREFVEIRAPGQPKSVAVEPVNAEHRERWPVQFQRFKQGLEEPLTGTPLEQWTSLTPATVLNFKSLGLRTVDEVASASDTVLQNMGPGGFELRRKAQAFMEHAAGAAPLEAAEARNRELAAQVELLQGQLRDLAALVEERTAPDEAPPRRARTA